MQIKPSTRAVASHSEAKKALKELATQKRLFTPVDPSDHDSFGEPLDYAQAEARLGQNQPVLVKVDLGRIENGTLPSGLSGMYFRGTDYEATRKEAFATFAHRTEGVLLSSFEDIERWDDDKFTPAEQKAAKALRDLQGAYQGSLTRVEVMGGIDGSQQGDGEYFWRADAPGKHEPGLYNPAKMEGGFLGMGKKPDRLFYTEAFDLLRAGQPVLLIDKECEQHTLNSLNDVPVEE